ncbi:hypothetical protein HAHE_24980 [Haloferula helveola]|uniref:Uncharacterized protein n=2 Tax=Haloferula helveola TaxID=490095 RepID=A0ABM7RDI9_9BACT|nr:hypothetical protein HAHE_24980 [Haloferula helveola]
MLVVFLIALLLLWLLFHKAPWPTRDWLRAKVRGLNLENECRYLNKQMQQETRNAARECAIEVREQFLAGVRELQQSVRLEHERIIEFDGFLDRQTRRTSSLERSVARDPFTESVWESPVGAGFMARVMETPEARSARERAAAFGLRADWQLPQQPGSEARPSHAPEAAPRDDVSSWIADEARRLWDGIVEGVPENDNSPSGTAGKPEPRHPDLPAEPGRDPFFRIHPT